MSKGKNVENAKMSLLTSIDVCLHYFSRIHTLTLTLTHSHPLPHTLSPSPSHTLTLSLTHPHPHPQSNKYFIINIKHDFLLIRHFSFSTFFIFDIFHFDFFHFDFFLSTFF